MTAQIALPTPRTPDPMTAPPLRWGILGTGGIAHTFAAALAARTRQRVVAVGSRTLARAEAFGVEVGARGYGSYAALVADPSVDVVYVATPHSAHREDALLALAAGKPVLVEKAFTRNAGEARAVVGAAAAAGLFCAEAMWTRFLPGTDILRQALTSGLLGQVTTVFADHGQPLWPNGPQRLSDPSLAGGALLDLGIYPVSFASFVLGGLAEVSATGWLTPEGVDAEEAVVVRGTAGGLGLLHATMAARTPTMASVIGTAGRIDVGDPLAGRGRWYAPAPLRFTPRSGDAAVSWTPETIEHGLAFEAAEVARCVTDGLTETPLMPLAETVAIMDVLDAVRDQLGVTYPGE